MRCFHRPHCASIGTLQWCLYSRRILSSMHKQCWHVVGTRTFRPSCCACAGLVVAAPALASRSRTAEQRATHTALCMGAVLRRLLCSRWHVMMGRQKATASGCRNSGSCAFMETSKSTEYGTSKRSSVLAGRAPQLPCLAERHHQSLSLQTPSNLIISSSHSYFLQLI